MSRNEYHFISHWHVKGVVAEVADVLRDPLSLAQWWPAVFVGVEEIPDSRGRAYRGKFKGWLPYTIVLSFREIEPESPAAFAKEFFGKMIGHGEWTLDQIGDEVRVTYDLHVRPVAPGMKTMTNLFRPLFIANHRWSMELGEISLQREVARRRATRYAAEEQDAADAANAAEIPPPPQPMSTGAAWATLAVVCVSLIVPGSLLLRAVRPKPQEPPEPELAGIAEETAGT